MSYRRSIIERDLSGFVSNNISEIGGMVIRASKGLKTPVKCRSEEDVLTYFGYPSSSYPDVFEAVSFVRESECWIAAPYGSDALYGGVDVSSGTITAFSTGRDYDSWEYGESSGLISHSFFSRSPQTDDLSVKVKSITGKQFKLSLYKTSTLGSTFITDYNYSLDRELDKFGKSLYIEDVFDNNKYLLFKVNAATSVTAYNLPGVTAVSFAGGSRGSAPQASDINTAWENFYFANKYQAKILMDPIGGYDTKINTIIQTYQKYAHGISVIALGSDADEAIAARQLSAIDSDNISYYTNWARIEDPYNNSSAWISHIGSIGKKYAMMEDTYDALSPAGIDENNHGGQLSDWKVLEVENDYSDTDLQNLDEAQLNPIILDQNYGLMVYGDKTAQVSNSDTSFVGTRRLYNYIIDTIDKQILRQQEFKLNDATHRFKAQSMTQTFLEPIINQGYLRDALAVCDETNNTDDVLERRQFILDVYVKVTPNSQFVTLRLTRLSQTQTVAEFIG